MINENDKKEVKIEVVKKLKLISELIGYDEFKHGFDYDGAMYYDILENATGLTYEEIERLRKEFFND